MAAKFKIGGTLLFAFLLSACKTKPAAEIRDVTFKTMQRYADLSSAGVNAVFEIVSSVENDTETKIACDTLLPPLKSDEEKEILVAAWLAKNSDGYRVTIAPNAEAKITTAVEEARNGCKNFLPSAILLPSGTPVVPEHSP